MFLYKFYILGFTIYFNYKEVLYFTDLYENYMSNVWIIIMLITIINNLINNFKNKNLFKFIINLYYLKKYTT